jgi:hypothetical protein
LVDGTVASAGDVIIKRHNDRRIRITATDWVKNGDRFTIRAVHERGDLEALHHHTGRVVGMPICYVREHVTLGYASTIHKSNENHSVTRSPRAKRRLRACSRLSEAVPPPVLCARQAQATAKPNQWQNRPERLAFPNGTRS